MIIESGAIIFMGMLLLAWKLPPSKILLLLSYPIATDLACSALAFAMHYGTFSGVMAAAVAGLMCSAMTGLGRKLVGYREGGAYVPGFIDWSRYA